MENEMIADIVAEKRRLADEREKSLGDQHSYVETLRFDADRIEAAWKREKSQSWHHREIEELVLRHEKELADARMSSGNAAAMREALESCLDFIMRIDRAFNPFMQNLLEDAIAKAKAALSKPPRNCDTIQSKPRRNCDVGTAEDQTERFKLFCNRRECVTCELNRRSPFQYGCFSVWAQMPYSEGGAS